MTEKELRDIVAIDESYRIERTVSTGNMDKFSILQPSCNPTCNRLATQLATILHLKYKPSKKTRICAT